MTLVEKICKAIGGDPEREPSYMMKAHAALQVVLDALREPSEEMLEYAGLRVHDEEQGECIYDWVGKTYLRAIADHLAKE